MVSLGCLVVSFCLLLCGAVSGAQTKGDVSVLVALIRGYPDPKVNPKTPALDSKIKAFRKEFITLSKRIRDTRFQAVDTKTIPLWFSRPSKVRLGKDMEVDVTVDPLQGGKHPLRVIWYRVKGGKRIKIANSVRTAKLHPRGALIPVIFSEQDAPTLYIGVAIAKDKKPDQ